MKVRPVFICGTCAENCCVLTTNTCEENPKQCPFIPGPNNFAEWVEASPKDIASLKSNNDPK